METPVFPAAQDATEERGPECWYIGQQPPLCTSSASHGGTCVGPAHNVSLYCTDSQFPVHCSKFISSCSPPLFARRGITRRNRVQDTKESRVHLFNSHEEDEGVQEYVQVIEL